MDKLMIKKLIANEINRHTVLKRCLMATVASKFFTMVMKVVVIFSKSWFSDAD
jgi:hypothetical protein